MQAVLPHNHALLDLHYTPPGDRAAVAAVDPTHPTAGGVWGSSLSGRLQHEQQQRAMGMYAQLGGAPMSPEFVISWPPPPPKKPSSLYGGASYGTMVGMMADAAARMGAGGGFGGEDVYEYGGGRGGGGGGRNRGAGYGDAGEEEEGVYGGDDGGDDGYAYHAQGDGGVESREKNLHRNTNSKASLHKSAAESAHQVQGGAQGGAQGGDAAYYSSYYDDAGAGGTGAGAGAGGTGTGAAGDTATATGAAGGAGTTTTATDDASSSTTTRGQEKHQTTHPRRMLGVLTNPLYSLGGGGGGRQKSLRDDGNSDRDDVTTSYGWDNFRVAAEAQPEWQQLSKSLTTLDSDTTLPRRAGGVGAATTTNALVGNYHAAHPPPTWQQVAAQQHARHQELLRKVLQGQRQRTVYIVSPPGGLLRGVVVDEWEPLGPGLPEGLPSALLGLVALIGRVSMALALLNALPIKGLDGHGMLGVVVGVVHVGGWGGVGRSGGGRRSDGEEEGGGKEHGEKGLVHTAGRVCTMLFVSVLVLHGVRVLRVYAHVMMV